MGNKKDIPVALAGEGGEVVDLPQLERAQKPKEMHYNTALLGVAMGYTFGHMPKSMLDGLHFLTYAKVNARLQASGKQGLGLSLLYSQCLAQSLRSSQVLNKCLRRLGM